MKHKLRIVVAIVVTTLSHNSAKAQSTTLEDNDSAAHRFMRVDKELNVVYGKIVKILKEPGSSKYFLPRFKEAQQAWIKYRDAQMPALWPEGNKDSARWIYGSVFNLCWTNALTSLERIRLEELKAWYAEFSDQIEGDACFSEIFESIASKITTAPNEHNKLKEEEGIEKARVK